MLLDNVNSRDEQKLNYAVKIEPSLGLDPMCIKNLLFLILNNDTGWTNVTEKQFQLTVLRKATMSTSLLPQKKLMSYAHLLKQIAFTHVGKIKILYLTFLDGKTVLWISRMIWKHTEST